MPPPAYWKGYLKLSLVSCPIALFPGTSEREKIRFHQLNKNTGNRIKYRKVDETTGDEVEGENIIKGYEVGKGDYVELNYEELDAVAIESKRVIDIDQFVPVKEIDQLYLKDPYYIVPDGEVGQQAFAVIREAIREEGMVALGKVIFTSREHVIALEPRGKGMLGITLRYPYEIRDERQYFDDIPDLKIPKDMLELARHIVESKAGHFDPKKFQDQYENALKDLIKKKRSGEPIEPPERPAPAKVINLMDALRRSVDEGKASGHRAPRRAGASSTVDSKARPSTTQGGRLNLRSPTEAMVCSPKARSASRQTGMPDF
jgi:DNA end-binding protein Ku